MMGRICSSRRVVVKPQEMGKGLSRLAERKGGQSSGGGNEAAEAFGVEGRIGDLASVQAVT